MGDTPTYCPRWSYKQCFLSPKGGVNICQGGDCCSMWLIFDRKDIWRKMGKMRERSGVEWQHSDGICHSGLYFFCCEVNDRLRGVGFRGVF